MFEVIGSLRVGGLPLTLALSPLAGRGDVPRSASMAGRKGAAYPFSPLLRGEGGGSRMRGYAKSAEVRSCL